MQPVPRPGPHTSRPSSKTEVILRENPPIKLVGRTTEEEVKVPSEYCSGAELNPFPELVFDPVLDGFNDGLPGI